MTQRTGTTGLTPLWLFLLMLTLAPAGVRAQTLHPDSYAPHDASGGSAVLRIAASGQIDPGATAGKHAFESRFYQAADLVSISAASVRSALAQVPERLVLAFEGLDLPPLELRPSTILTPNAVVVAGTREGDRVLEPAIRSYASARPADAGTDWSAAVIAEDGLRATFSIRDETYVLRPLGTGGEQHLLYRQRDVVDETPPCGVQDPWRHSLQPTPAGTVAPQPSPAGMPAPLPLSADALAPAGTPAPQPSPALYATSFDGPIDSLEISVALEADYDMFREFGSVDAAAAWMLSTVAAVSLVFERDTGARLVVPYLRVWESAGDPYSSSNSDLYETFKAYWNAEMGHVDRTLVHLFSVKRTPEYSGHAGINVLCDRARAYGLTSFVRPDADRSDTFAHELGHNLGSPHTHSCSWPDGPLDYCHPVEGTCYDGPVVQTTGTIMSYCDRKLEFHPIVRQHIRQRAEMAHCVPGYFTLPISAADSTGLDTFYQQLGGESWSQSDGWQQGPARDRFGVLVRNGFLRSLVLSGNQLRGSIPAVVGDWEQLLRLDLSFNQLDGPIPGTIGNAAQLQSVTLNNNRLTGAIPDELGQSASIVHLDLASNALFGPIPSSIGALAQVRIVDLSDNALDGPIPTSIGALNRLQLLMLNGNELSGPIPDEIAGLRNALMIRLDENRLGGSLPDALGALDELVSLLLNDNQFTGTLPDALAAAGKLSFLYVNDNPGLSGPLPASLAGLPAMQQFYFHSTGICLPANETLLAWLEAIPDVRTTNLECADVGAADALLAGARIGAAYPNPAHAQAQLEVDVPQPSPVRVTIHDPLGRRVALVLDEVVFGVRHIALPVASLPSGHYFVRMTIGSRIETVPLTVVR